MRVTSVLVRALEMLWEGICEQEPAVPANVLIIPSYQPGQTVGHFDPRQWVTRQLPYHEVIIDPRAARWGYGALEVLLHEAAHARAFTFGENDGKGEYHNRTFVKHAEALGLVCKKDHRPRLGWRSDLPGPTPERWRLLRQGYDRAVADLPYAKVRD